jgi:hypothetical protein
MSWFLEDGVIKLHKTDTDRHENSPLWHVTWLLSNKDFSIQQVNRVLSFIDIGDIKGTRSHDNMTGILTYLVIARDKMKKYGFKDMEEWCDIDIKSLNILPDYTHPRDFLYIAYLQNRWWFWLFSPFWFVILLIIFIYMAATKYKVRPHGKFFKTDTEILYWIRLQLPKRYFIIHMTKPFVIPLLKRKYGEDWFYRMMDIYYEDPEHPNRTRVIQ